MFGEAQFQELAGAHDGDACGELGHHGQAVRNENVGEGEFALALPSVSREKTPPPCR
jgi:hypothetical protein